MRKDWKKEQEVWLQEHPERAVCDHCGDIFLKKLRRNHLCPECYRWMGESYVKSEKNHN